MTDLRKILADSKVVPVVTLQEVAHAVPLARALMAGGINAIEITLRSDAAYDGIRAIKADVPEIALGIGTVIHENQMDFCIEVRPNFIVTPGTTPELYDAIAPTGLTLVPGIATASEAVAALQRGHDFVKLFPAEAAGGVALLKGIGGPIPQLTFMPTGGISPTNAPDYLALPNVLCVGGSWVTRGSDMAEITKRAKAATAL